MTARPWIVRFAAIVSILFPALLAVEARAGWAVDPAVVFYSGVVVAFALVGWLITERQPANAVGPLMVGFALPFALSMPADVYARVPGAVVDADLVALFASSVDAPLLALLALTLIRFPDGSPPSPRWRWANALTLAVFVLTFVGVALSTESFLLYPRYDSPIGIAGVPGQALVYLGYVGMFGLLVGAVGSLTLRWRHGGRTERDQLKWIGAAAALALIAEILNVATFSPEQPNSAFGLAAALSFALVPVAMGVAILRYRLYQIDRLISRTVSYAIVIAILGAVFVGVVLLLQTVLTAITGGQTVAVAASTLAVFALFQPVLRQVRRAVDRRFDRARYDAARTAAEFSERLRNEVDMAAVTTDLQATVSDAIAPSSLGLWLRTGWGNR